MRLAVRLRWRRPGDPTVVAGAFASVLVAVGLYTRFSIHQWLWRDEAIYVYGAQRLVHGVPPYASIFDPKAPLATMLAGVAVAVARLVGGSDLYAVRGEFFVLSCLTVLAVYLLAARLWRSAAAGVLAAAVFASFPVFALDAIGGPDAKSPAVLALVVSMWLLMERRWFWAGVASAAATLIWQPLVIFPIAALLLPLVRADRAERRRAAVRGFAGVAIPTALVGIYFLATGAFGKLVEATVVFPLTGNRRVPLSLHQRLTHMPHVISLAYGRGEEVLFEAGLAALFVIAGTFLLVRRRTWRTALCHPLVCVVLLTGVFVLGFLVYYDFQGPQDTLALTPYAALGVSGVAALLLRVSKDQRMRRAVGALAVAGAAAIVGMAWSSFEHRDTNNVLLAEYSDACGLSRLLADSGGLYALGDPTPLVLTHRGNPDRFIYLEEAVSGWKIRHTAGGFDGWVAQIQAARPSVIVLQSWDDTNAERMQQALRSLGYTSDYLGRWHLYLPPAGIARAVTDGVRLTDRPTPAAEDLAGQALPEHANCAPVG